MAHNTTNEPAPELDPEVGPWWDVLDGGDLSEATGHDAILDGGSLGESGVHLARVQAAEDTPPRPAQPDHRSNTKSTTQIAGELWEGRWGTDGWQDRVTAAGYDAAFLELLVSRDVGRGDFPESARPLPRKPAEENGYENVESASEES